MCKVTQMKLHWFLKALLIATGLGLVIWILMGFALLDFIGTSDENVWETKPWRPIARVAFGFIMISLVVMTTGVLLHIINRDRST